jgi:dihydropteroate synthase
MNPGPRALACRTRSVDLSEPVVMGVLNVTPDSFSDGGRFADVDAAVARAVEMVEQAPRSSTGGESTRPGRNRCPSTRNYDE